MSARERERETERGRKERKERERARVRGRDSERETEEGVERSETKYAFYHVCVCDSMSQINMIQYL